MDLGGLAKFVGEGRESVRSFLRSAPSPGQLARSRRRRVADIHATLPSTLRVGETATLTLQVWDEYERLVRGVDGAVELSATDPEAGHPTRVVPGDEGWTRADGVAFETPGTHYVRLEHPETGVEAVSNPVEVVEGDPSSRLYWGDIHLHSRLSDGVGSMAKGFRFGRDVMDLDVVAYTDHDTMGFFIPPSLQRRRMHDRLFDRAATTADAFDEPGSFVALFGYEWTKQPNRGGHVNVYFETSADATLFDSIAAESDTYEKLWARLDEWRERTGRDVVTIPHHTAEGMYPFDFSATDYDDDLEPLVEVYSQWGNSERSAADGNEKPIGGIASGEVGRPGHYAQDALELGHRVGLMAASDYHGPRPGHSLIHVPPHVPRLREAIRDGLGWGTIWRLWDERSYPGGLVAFHAPELTREAIFGSLRGRQVYGTTQPDRIRVSFSVGGTRLRDPTPRAVVDGPTDERRVEVAVAGTAPLERVTVVKNNADWRTVSGAEATDADLSSYTATATFPDDERIEGMAWDDDRGTDDDAYYVRVHQADGGAAWAGPIWVGTG